MTNSMYERQNETKFITYLAAQRQIYNECRRLMNWWYLIIFLSALLTTDILDQYPGLKPYLVLIVIIFMAIEIVLSYFLDVQKEKAAKIQELFDCELFELNWNDLIGEKPSKDMIEHAANRHFSRNKDKRTEALKNWYRDYSSLSKNEAALSCQIENVSWDSKLRTYYVWFLIIVGILISLFLFLLALLFDLDMRIFLTGPVFLTLPILYELSQIIIKLLKIVSEQNRVREVISSVKSLQKNDGNTEVVIQPKIRQIQSEIYRVRASSLLIGKWFYQFFRPTFEKISFR